MDLIQILSANALVGMVYCHSEVRRGTCYHSNEWCNKLTTDCPDVMINPFFHVLK